MVGQFSLFAILALALIAEVAHAKPPQKIVGGDYASPGEFPYQVSVQLNGKHHCGGSIIGPRHILTAAHCVDKIGTFRNLVVVTGSVVVNSGGQTHIPSAVRFHHGYTHQNDGPHDIAVITLDADIIFNPHQAPISLPASLVAPESIATVSGWGYQSTEVPYIVKDLRKLDMRIMNAAECRQLSPSPLYPTQICGFLGAGQGTCIADSGGPLVVNNVLVGVVSYGQPCALGYPDIFTSVYDHIGWIREVMSLA